MPTNDDVTERSKAGRVGKAGQRGRSVDSKVLDSLPGLIGPGPYRRDRLIEYLHAIMDQNACIDAAFQVALANLLGIAVVEVHEVASFYHHFKLTEQPGSANSKVTIRVCDSLSCELAGSAALIAQLSAKYDIERVSCVGRCEQAPLVVVGQKPLQQADFAMVQQAVEAGDQQIELPEHSIDLTAYQAKNGYQLLKRCLSGEIDADRLIEQLQGSELRGLGGAGFPVGRKWQIVGQQPAPRLFAVNIDEGEPGTFKDRYYLENDPHRMLEGMLIAAWATGCEKIYIYIRDEYPALQHLLQASLDDLDQHSEIEHPPIEIRRGAGAYICGEESAMIESIEGKRGLPRQRPPYIAEVGLFGRPTLEHNAETLFWVRDLIEQGAEAFAAAGVNGRKGWRSFSLSGRVQKPGVWKAPAGITIRQLIEEYGGGMLPGHEFYAYLPGGASGGILPAMMDDIPLDFDTLQPYGCFIGSAAVIVLSKQDSARAAALNTMRFFARESCGQCTPCRVGTVKAAELMAAPIWDTDRLEQLASVMEDASICGLGQAAPNSLRCVMRYFADEISGEPR